MNDVIAFLPYRHYLPQEIGTLPGIVNTYASYMGFQRQMARASLVAQWLRICLPMQGTRVRALVWEDPTCRGVTEPVSHNY